MAMEFRSNSKASACVIFTLSYSAYSVFNDSAKSVSSQHNVALLQNLLILLLMRQDLDRFLKYALVSR